jgi:HPt (histidine-containing phosphotransfer) domain-containing protein
VLLRREAHSLKGASGNVGAVALSQACKGLEHAAADGHLEEIPGAWATLQARYVEAREALQELA